MDEIVTRVAEAAPREPGAGGGIGLDVSMHVKAQTAGGHKKVAEAWAEIGGADLSRWHIYCDEGTLTTSGTEAASNSAYVVSFVLCAAVALAAVPLAVLIGARPASRSGRELHHVPTVP